MTAVSIGPESLFRREAAGALLLLGLLLLSVRVGTSAG